MSRRGRALDALLGKIHAAQDLEEPRVTPNLGEGRLDSPTVGPHRMIRYGLSQPLEAGIEFIESREDFSEKLGMGLAFDVERFQLPEKG